MKISDRKHFSEKSLHNLSMTQPSQDDWVGDGGFKHQAYVYHERGGFKYNNARHNISTVNTLGTATVSTHLQVFVSGADLYHFLYYSIVS